jgi:deoxycytidine triphosphate deaminase
VTVLSYHTIEELCLTTRPMISPFSGPEKFDWFSKQMSYGISHCGYDIRLSKDMKAVRLGPEEMTSEYMLDPHTKLDRDSFISYQKEKGVKNPIPYSYLPEFLKMKRWSVPFMLAHTLEQFDMPKDVMGVVHDKSTLARLGVAVQNTIIEPGWRGFLTLEITTHDDCGVDLLPGMPIAQVIFHRMDREVEGYAGKYQDQPNEPVEAM